MIVTFYSFKGGVGRSFALVETAVQLAALGRSVAVWDLDLEAPGLQKIPELRPLDEALEIGTLDLIRELIDAEYTFPDESLAKALLHFALPAPLAAAGGRLSFLLPGKLDGSYPGRFAAIDWAGLFDPKENAGLAFFYKIAHSLTYELGYEILLIDSRTGFTDLGAVCTLQLPDLVILVTNLNEQNLAGIEQVHAAITATPARHSGKLTAFVLANMVPGEPKDRRKEKMDLLRPNHAIRLRPELLLTDEIPTLSGLTEAAADFNPVVQEIENRRIALEARAAREVDSKLSRAKAKADPEELDALRRRGIYEKAKTFEEKVAELFSLLGYRTTVDYKRDDMQFDVRLELTVGALPIHGLVECKDTDRPVTQQQIREFASKVEYAAGVDKLPYQAILIARGGFANNAHEVAKNLRIHLQTYEQLLRSLVDLRPTLDAAVLAFRGSALERHYVEQDVVFEGTIKPGETVEAKPLTQEVLRWLGESSGTFLTLLGDFGCGKTSFSKRLACELALKAREELSDGRGSTRVPILIDLREGGSTTVTLESLLTHHFQRLSSQPFNPQALLHLNREGHLLLIFDGFDETIAYTEPGRYVENLRQILRAAEGKAKVLLTCRTHYFKDRPEVLRRFGKAPEVVSSQGATHLYEEIQERPGAEIGYLLEFREEQIAEYLRKAFPPPADWQAFREQIRRTYNLDNLAERPFLLEIIVKTLPRLTAREGEVTLADLYETYCESWFSHTDFRLTLTRERKVALVEYLARLVWDSPENRVHYDLLFDKAAEFFKDKHLTLHDKERIDYEVRTALFLHRDAEGYYSFIHRSFLEFFIARTIRAGLAAGDSSCLALKRITREVAFFLEFWSEARRIPEVAGRVLETSYQAGISENALLLLYFHARATLGPLAGPGADAEKNPLAIREAFSKIRPKTLHLEGVSPEGAKLPGIDLSGARLRGAFLPLADLRYALLDYADLSKAWLDWADLRGGSAKEADLSDASLTYLDAQEVSFQGADLRHAKLKFGRFTRADFSQAETEGIQTFAAGFLGAILPRELSWEKNTGRPHPTSLDLRIQLGHSWVINSMAWSPDGMILATASGDDTIKLWDTSPGRLLNTLVSNSFVNSVAWSPDGQRLATGSDDNGVQTWDAASGQLLNVFAKESSVFAVAWSPDGQQIATGSQDHEVRLWDAASGRLLKTFVGHEKMVLTVAWSPDGQRLASGSSDESVQLWDADSGRLTHTLASDSSINAIAWSPDGQQIATGSDDRSVRLWDTASGRLLNTLLGHERSVNSVAWSPDGQILASGSYGNGAWLWDTTSGRLLKILANDSSASTLTWSPDGRSLATGGSASVRLWDVASGRLLNTLVGYKDQVNSSVTWSPDGQRLASGFLEEIRLWDAGSGRLLNLLEGHEDSVSIVSWSPDGRYLASGSSDKTVRLWDAGSGRPLKTFEGHENAVFSVAWSPDGRRLASGSSDKTVRFWDVDSGRLLNTLEGHESLISSLAWSPDGQSLASGSWDNSVRLWNTDSGKLLKTFHGHEGWAFSVAWSPDGQCLASSSTDKTVRLWDVASGRLLKTLIGHERPVNSIAWSPDGQHLASGSHDNTVRIWDPDSGEELQKFEFSFRLTSLRWKPTGRRLALSLSTGCLEIWALESAHPRLLVRLYPTLNGSGLAATPDGYVSGPPEALEYVRFGDGWALYDLTDVPERLSPERVAAALGPGRTGGRRRRKKGTAAARD